ncbi:MAG: leucine-rich repeat protein [Lachnospiraceae bacterium]|nr:leucine-rich repeat protein [Candidatus Equihabitans merdae]
MATPALAEETINKWVGQETSGTYGQLTWNVDENQHLTISGTGAMTNTGGGAAPWGTDIVSAEIEYGITNIDEYAFYECTKLKEVTIPNTVKSIDWCAFAKCTGLTSITFPGSLETIGVHAFNGCTGLTKLTLPGNIRTIDGYAFKNCIGLKEIEFSEGLETISYEAFRNCTGLTSLVFAEGLKNIDHEAFADCTGLAYMEFPVSLERVGDNAFAGRNALEKVISWNPLSLHPLFGKGNEWVADPDLYEKVMGLKYRIAGTDRVQTSLMAAELMPSRDDVKFDTVILADAWKFPDALTGSYLAAKNRAPIILVDNGSPSASVNYIKSHLGNGGKVYILGGEAAVSSAVEQMLSQYEVKRLAGADRYATNLAILDEAGVWPYDAFLVASGTNYADSLSASATGLPMMIVGDELTDAQREWLMDHRFTEHYILGGDKAVSDGIEEELLSCGIKSVSRLAGATRYETSVLIAERFIPEAKEYYLAYAWNFPDGLSGGALAYANHSALILTGGGNTQTAGQYLRKMMRKDFKLELGILGGEKLISDADIMDMVGY